MRVSVRTWMRACVFACVRAWVCMCGCVRSSVDAYVRVVVRA